MDLIAPSPEAPRTRRRARRAGVAAAACLLASGLLVSTAPAASAAWFTQHALHGAKIQVCKVHVEGQRYRVRVRVDNRNGKHVHVGQVQRTRNGNTASVTARAGAGAVSGAKSILVRTGDQLGSSAGESNGTVLGDTLRLGDLPRC